MKITSLDATNLRILSRLHLEPGEGINFIVGPNGSGKTSVLEAIYLAGRGRSFRHSDAGPLIRQGGEHATVVVAMVDERTGRRSILGVQRGRTELLGRLDGQDVKKRSVLAETLPVLWVGSQPQGFFEMGPAVRRGFIDMGLFHVEPSYLKELSEFHRALRQRNAAIRSADAAAIRTWNRPFAVAAEKVDVHRAAFVETLMAGVERELDAWGIDLSLRYRYRSGWRPGAPLLEQLEQKAGADQQLGYTSVGPQRADLQLLVEGGVVEKTLSRGQLKLAVVAANLALHDIIAARSGRSPILLVDDLAAELDRSNRQRVIAAIEARGLQAFLTEIEEGALESVAPQTKMFHVEQSVQV